MISGSGGYRGGRDDRRRDDRWDSRSSGYKVGLHITKKLTSSFFLCSKIPVNLIGQLRNKHWNIMQNINSYEYEVYLGATI